MLAMRVRRGAKKGNFREFQNELRKTSNTFPKQRRRTARCAQIAGSLLESAGKIFSVAARSYARSVF
jgi:hypothetical protein